MTLEEYTKAILDRPSNFAYFGDDDLSVWGTMLTVNRDSEALQRSNWEVIKDDMMARFPNDVKVLSTSHWAVGWLDELLVNTDNPGALDAAYEWHEQLDNYIVADEQHYMDTEQAEIEECFESYGRDEVIDWLEEHGNPLGLLDENGEPIEEYTSYLFWLFEDGYRGECEENTLREIRGDMRRSFERTQPPLLGEEVS